MTTLICKHCAKVAEWRWDDPDGKEYSYVCQQCMETLDCYRTIPLRHFIPIRGAFVVIPREWQGGKRITKPCNHSVNPETDRCVLCGKNRFNRALEANRGTPAEDAAKYDREYKRLVLLDLFPKTNHAVLRRQVQVESDCANPQTWSVTIRHMTEAEVRSLAAWVGRIRE